MRPTTLALLALLLAPTARADAPPATEPDAVTRWGMPGAVGFLGLALIGAHLRAPDVYSARTNTISDLGAQGYDDAWLMRTGFVGFGASVAGLAARDLVLGARGWPEATPLVLYGASMTLTGVFSAPPFVDGLASDATEAELHGLFATTAGVSLTAGMLVAAIRAPDWQRRLFHLGALVLTSATSAAFGLDPARQGVWQRVLWLEGLGWLALQ